jgi:hypothetical protein
VPGAFRTPSRTLEELERDPALATAMATAELEARKHARPPQPPAVRAEPLAERLPEQRSPADRRRYWLRLPRGLGFSAAVYVGTRIPILIAIVVYLRSHPRQQLWSIATLRDGWWYLKLANYGYSDTLRSPAANLTDTAHSYSDWAFFPGYPLLIRLTHVVTTLAYLPSTLIAASVTGLLAVWAVYMLGDGFGGVRVARGSALLFAAWPGSAALTFPYSEGLFVAAAAGSLAFLMRRRWIAAGLLGAVATATRPTGLALVAAALVVAVVHIGRERDWRPLITPIGAAAFVVFAWVRTGDVLAWRHAENLWSQQLDFSKELVSTFWRMLITLEATVASPPWRTQLIGTLVMVFGFFGLVAMGVALWTQRHRANLGLVVYALVTTFMIIGYSAVAPRPRTVLAVIPGFVWLAAWLPRRALIAASAVLVGAAGVVAWLWMWAVIP